jgi:hypothetical protein
MYTTCLFCHGPLGRNDVVEALPVGRRLAFDAARGRLWVVCRRCARWNLTPFDERWEAIEQCERAFRGTRLRVSTDNVGLARVGDGVELVRVGAALRPELAAWRYGEQFGRRRRRHAAVAAAGSLGLAAVLLGGPAAGLYTLGSVQAVNWLGLVASRYLDRRRAVARVPVGTGGERRLLPLAPVHVRRSRLLPEGEGRWSLELEYSGPGERLAFGLGTGLRHVAPSVVLAGGEALRVAGRLLPHLNRTGGDAPTVADAVRVLEHGGTADRCFAAAAARPGTETKIGSLWDVGGRRPVEPGTLAALAPAVRLALEMAAHEESERRALEGELAELERAWQEAEEVAAIADALLEAPPDANGGQTA